jgi:hypothetical protein
MANPRSCEIIKRNDNSLSIYKFSPDFCSWYLPLQWQEKNQKIISSIIWHPTISSGKRRDTSKSIALRPLHFLPAYFTP